MADEACKYFMDDPREKTRLTAQVDTRAWVHRYVPAIATASGSILDVGCGPGVVASEIARSYPDMSVTAMDVSDDRLAAARKNFAGLANAVACRGDILSPPFGPGAFDGALCRFVLEYLPEKEAAVRHMASLLKNGGKLLLQDVDGQLVWNYPPDVSLDRDVGAVLQALEKTGFDPFVGRKLFALCCKAGLQVQSVQVEAYDLIAGSITPEALRLWEMKLDIAVRVGETILGSRAKAVELRDRFLTYLKRPDTFTYSTLITVVALKS